MTITATGAAVHQPAAGATASDPANLAAHEAARQEVEASKAAHKQVAGKAATSALGEATAAVGHAAGWVGAKLNPNRTHTYTQVVDSSSPAAVPVNAGAYGAAAATQTSSTLPQGAVGSTLAPSPEAVAHQSEASAHGAGFKAHGAAALRGTGSALSHAKDALSEKLAAKRYEKYEREQAPMQPRYPAVVTPVAGHTAAGAATSAAPTQTAPR